MQYSPSTSAMAASYLARSLAALDTGHLPKSKPHAPVRTTSSPTWGDALGQSVVCVGTTTTLGGSAIDRRFSRTRDRGRLTVRRNRIGRAAPVHSRRPNPLVRG